MAGARANIRAEISADTTKFQGAMRRAQTVAQATGSKIGQSLKNAGASLGGLGKQALRSGAALGAMAAAIGGAVMAKGLKMAADLGGRLSDIAARTGIAAGQLLLLERAFVDNGIAVEKIGPIINKMQKAIVDATEKGGAMADTFADLGLNLDDLRAMSPEDQFAAIQKAISGISDPAKRAAMAMQLFGKSGGALLTLFADTGAFKNAGKFVGSQAEIMNRSAGVFDAISDKLGRIPDKLQGFFVGFLEPISGALDGILTKFESFDFAASGLKLGESFMRAIEMVRGALDSLTVTEMFELAGLLLKVKLMEAGNEIFKTVSAVVALFKSGEIGSAMESAALLFQSVLFTTFSTLAKMLEEAFGPDSTIGKRLGGAAFSMGVQGNIAAKEREALNAKQENGPSLIDRFKEERSKIGDAFQIPDSDIGKIEDSFQKIRIAADKHTSERMKKAAETAADFAGGVKSIDPIFDSLGQKAKEEAGKVGKAFTKGFSKGSETFDSESVKDAAADAMSPMVDTMANAISDAPARRQITNAVKDLLKPAGDAAEKAGRDSRRKNDPYYQEQGDEKSVKVESPIGSADFRGLDELKRMNEGGPRSFGSKGAALGGDNVFARDRARLGLASGLSTGGLGEKRKVGTLREEQKQRRDIYAAQQVDLLERIERQQAEALTVN